MSDSKPFELTPSVSIILAGVIIAGAIVYTNLNPGPVSAQGAAAATAPTVNVNIAAPSADDHIIGSPTAPIVLVEYSDFQCPFCSIVYPTLKRIVEESNGQVAWVMRHFPLTSIHPEANPAANAAECIAEQLGNEGYWQYADAVFADTTKLNAAYSASIAKALGADMTTYASCVAANKYQAKIDAEALEAQNNGGQGTPYTVVYGNGEQKGLSGALPYDTFMAVINGVKARQQ